MTATLVTFAGLQREDGVIAGVSTRHGGVSTPPFDTLNLSLDVGDSRDNVVENRRRFATALGVSFRQLTTTRQVHGADVAVLYEIPSVPPEADIAITNVPGVLLLMRFADCVPVLLFDPVRRCVGLAHAGWRGCQLGAPAVAVAALQREFGSRPSDLRAAIGPCIGPCCYDVGPEVARLFADYRAARVSSGGALRLDLRKIVLDQLVGAGVPSAHVEVSEYCTACRTDLFYSHRASGGRTGRFGAAIMLEP